MPEGAKPHFKQQTFYHKNTKYIKDRQKTILLDSLLDRYVVSGTRNRLGHFTVLVHLQVINFKVFRPVQVVLPIIHMFYSTRSFHYTMISPYFIGSKSAKVCG